MQQPSAKKERCAVMSLYNILGDVLKYLGRIMSSGVMQYDRADSKIFGLFFRNL